MPRGRTTDDFLHLVTSLKVWGTRTICGRGTGILFHFWLTFFDWIRPVSFPFFFFFLVPFFTSLLREHCWNRCLRVVGKNCSKKKKVSHEIHGVLLILHRFERNIIKISQLSISRFLKKIFQISSLLNFSILWYHQIEMKIRNYREYQWIINYC